MFSRLKPTFLIALLITISVGACNKKDDPGNQPKETNAYSSRIVVRWLEQQLKMFRLPLAFGTAPSADRAFAYAGVALYESVVPGMPSYQPLAGQLDRFPLTANPLPKTTADLAYYWPASANAALAEINRKLFSGAAAQTSINELEIQLHGEFASEADQAMLQRSVEYGRAVAAAVWAWAETDGIAIIAAKPVYTVPADAGPGAWVLTSAGNPANPYHMFRKLIVAGSNTDAPAPPLPFSYSTDPNSEYYKMAKEVYDISKTLTPDQKQIALYHREGPTVNGGSYGGGSSIAGQLAAVFTTANASLDVAAEAFAKVGIGSYDGLTTTFIQKYQFLTMRPITYIKANIQADWNTVYGTPLYPEYPAGHPTNGGVLSVMLASVFGKNFSFSVDYYGESNWPGNGLTKRHYATPDELAEEMAMSRVYAGIHYKPGVYAGVAVGKKVAQNILAKVTFRKK